MPDEAPGLIHVRGTHYEMGVQHGKQVSALRPAILAAIAAREAQLEQDAPDAAFFALVDETRHLLERAGPAILEQIYGIADGLDLSREQLVNYSLVPFLRDSFTTLRRLSEGCTTWAASAPVTRDGGPILVKNRDYTLAHAPLQIAVRAEPASGYRYTYLTSAGSPGVFVAGFNEAGLAVVDTHVASLDVGPGLPDYALAMHILEQHDNVRSAVAYLQTAPRLGRNNFLLADGGGDIVAFEIGHQRCATLETLAGYLVNTNHFNSVEMRSMFVDTEPEVLQGNTFLRYQHVNKALQAAMGAVDVAFARELMSYHAGRLDSICRHPTPQSDASTIAGMIFLPHLREMHFCLERPCQAPFYTVCYE